MLTFRLLTHGYQFFSWLRFSLKKDGVTLHLRYQSYVFYASILWGIYGMSKVQAHQLLKFLILSSLPQIRNSKTPRVAYETVIELCFLLFQAGLGSRKCVEYRISRGHIINRFEEYSECNLDGYSTNEIVEYLQKIVFQQKAM